VGVGVDDGVGEGVLVNEGAGVNVAGGSGRLHATKAMPAANNMTPAVTVRRLTEAAARGDDFWSDTLPICMVGR